MDLTKIFQSKAFAGFIGGVVVFLAILLIFKAGQVVGFRKADFACRWGGNYHRNFAGPEGGFFMGMGDRNFIDANGTIGQIIKIDGQNFVIQGKDNMEKVILVTEKTVINRLRDTVKFSELKLDDYVVVIGEPTEAGQIEAKLIRLVPPPSTANSSGENLPQRPNDGNVDNGIKTQ